jgi:hypothetical protein
MIVMTRLALVAALVAVSAFAGTPPKQNHQCMKDGAVIQKTKKECAKEGGKWEKMADAAKPAPAPAATPDEKPTPKAE